MKKVLFKFLSFAFYGNLFFERAIFIIYLLDKGMGLAQVTLWQSIANLGMLVGEIPTGLLGDRLGKKHTLIIGKILLTLYFVLMITSTNFYGFILASILFGIGSTFISGTDEAYLYDIISKKGNNEGSVKYLGYYSAVITLATGIAMALGGVIQLSGWIFVFLIGGISQIISMIFLIFLPNIKSKLELTSKINLLQILKTTLKTIKNDKLILNIMLYLGINIGIVSAVYILAQDFLGKIGYSTTAISLIFSIECLLSSIIFSSVQKIIDKVGVNISINFSFIIVIIAFSLLIITNKILIIVCIFVISLFNNYYTTILSDIFNTRIPQEVRATTISCFSMVSSLLMSIIFVLIGIIGPSYMIFISIVGIVSTILLGYLYNKKIKLML